MQEPLKFLSQVSHQSEHSGYSLQGRGGDPRDRGTSVLLLGSPMARLRASEHTLVAGIGKCGYVCFIYWSDGSNWM